MSSPAVSPKVHNESLILAILAAVQFTNILDFMISLPLGSQLMRVFDITPEQFSHLGSAYGLAAAITGLIGGFFMDRFDRKKTLLAVYTGFGLATLACALAPSYQLMVAARFTAGAFGGLAGSVVSAMVGDVVPPERRGRGMSIVMSAFPIASALGVPLSLWLAGVFEWHAPFYLIAGLSVPIFAIAAWALPSLPPHKESAPGVKQMRELLSVPTHWWGLAMSAFLVFTGGCVISFLAPSMVANAGLSEKTQLPLIYVAGGIATIFSMQVVGRLTDRHDKLHVLSGVTCLTAIVVLIVTNLPVVHVSIAMLITALFMVSMSGRFAPAMAMLTNAVNARYRGSFMSLNSSVQQGASSVANYVAGLIVMKNAAGHLVGFPRVGIISVASMGITLLLAIRLRKLAPHAARNLPKITPVAAEPAA